MTTIKLKNGSGAPTAGDLVQGEPALDLTNKRLYTEDSGGTVIEVGTNPGTDVTFADNRKAIFGAGSDLQIYHDGSNSYIDDQGTGGLYIRSSSNMFLTAANGEKYFRGTVNGAATLYYDDAEKLATTSTGIDVTGGVTTDAYSYLNGLRISGADTGNTIYQQSGALSISSASGDISLKPSGATILTATSTGIDVTGDVSLSGSALINGSVPRVTLTDTDGTNTIGDIRQLSDAIVIKSRNGSSNGVIKFNGDNGTTETEYARFDSSGNLGIGSSNPSAKLDLSGTNRMQLRTDDSFPEVRSMNTTGSAFKELGLNGLDLRFLTSNTERMRINSSGNVGINTTSPAATLHTVANSGTTALLTVGASGNNIASFYTSGSSQVMTLDSSGNLLVGCTALPSGGAGGAGFEVGQSGGRTILQLGTTVTTAEAVARFYNPNGAVGSISLSGSATAYNTSSDERLKENIIDAPSASDDIDAIQVRSFDWKADGSHQKYGMVAQELQSVAPEAVSTGETEEDMMGVDYSKLVPMMMKEIQSLRARVAQLEGEN